MISRLFDALHPIWPGPPDSSGTAATPPASGATTASSPQPGASEPEHAELRDDATGPERRIPLDPFTRSELATWQIWAVALLPILASLVACAAT